MRLSDESANFRRWENKGIFTALRRELKTEEREEAHRHLPPDSSHDRCQTFLEKIERACAELNGTLQPVGHETSEAIVKVGLLSCERSVGFIG